MYYSIIKRIFFYLVILVTTAQLFSIDSLYAQGSAESGMAFLKYGFGARNIAMGDLGVVAVNDLTALNYNPALLAEINNPQLSFTHNSHFQDLSSELFAGCLNVYGLPLAIGLNTTNISNVEIRTKPGDAEGSFDVHYFSGSISTGFKLSRQLLLGGTFKYLYESFYTDESNGYAFDIGAAYKNIFTGLDAGVSIRNLGSMNALRNASSKLPADILIGASYNFSFSDFNCQPVAGFQKYLDQDESHLRMGFEIIYKNFLALRAGYLSGNDAKNISTGFGINWSNFDIDYAYVPVKYGLGDSHIITLVYTFN